MSTSAHYVKDKEIVTREIAGETVIVPVKGGVGDLNSIYTLNQSGTMVWDLLGAGRPVHEILSSVCTEYEVSREEAERDIQEFLDSLQTAGLICPLPESGG